MVEACLVGSDVLLAVLVRRSALPVGFTTGPLALVIARNTTMANTAISSRPARETAPLLFCGAAKLLPRTYVARND